MNPKVKGYSSKSQMEQIRQEILLAEEEAVPRWEHTTVILEDLC